MAKEIKTLLAERNYRVQAQVVLNAGGAYGCGVTDVPGPSGFCAFNFHGCLPVVEDWLALCVHGGMGFKPWRHTAAPKYPSLVPADWYKPTVPRQKLRGPATPAPQLQLTGYLVTLRDAAAGLGAAEQTANPDLDTEDFGTWARSVAPAWAREHPFPADCEVNVTLDMPVCVQGSVIIWRGIHGNMAPYDAAAVAGSAHNSTHAVSFILDCVADSVFRGDAEKAAYKAYLAQFLATGNVDSCRSGSNQSGSMEAAWFAATGGPPALAEFDRAQRVFMMQEEEGEAPRELALPAVLKAADTMRLNGFAVLTPAELMPDPAERAVFLGTTVPAALAEFHEFFQYVVYDRVGLSRPAGDPFRPIRSEKDAAAATGNPHVMRTSAINAEGVRVWAKVAQQNSLCSRFCGMGPATTLGRGAATVALKDSPCLIRLFRALYGERSFCIPERYRVKLSSSEPCLFTPHVDAKWSVEWAPEAAAVAAKPASKKRTRA